MRVARRVRFTPGTMLVFDRGYADYEWFRRLTRQQVYFVTRLKDKADYGLVEERELPRRKGVLRDQVIFFYPIRARQGVFLPPGSGDETKDRRLVFLTNQMTLSAATIAAIYKQRWSIELFFKALKRSLRVKTFVGTSANALKTQIWAALIATNREVRACIPVAPLALEKAEACVGRFLSQSEAVLSGAGEPAFWCVVIRLLSRWSQSHAPKAPPT